MANTETADMWMLLQFCFINQILQQALSAQLTSETGQVVNGGEANSVENMTPDSTEGSEFVTQQSHSASSLPGPGGQASTSAPYVCICGKTFQYRSVYAVHLQTHSNERPYTCPECGKKFARESYLTIHRRIHSGEKPFVCEICRRAFSVKSNMNAHRRIHSGERPFGCQFCDKRFSYKKGKTIHERCHTGERPFICGRCGGSFAQLANLKTHQRSYGH